LAAAGATWISGSASAANVTVTPATGFYGDLRFLLESRLNTRSLSPTLAAEVGRASGFVARSDGRVIGATGGFFIGASAGGGGEVLVEQSRDRFGNRFLFSPAAEPPSATQIWLGTASATPCTAGKKLVLPQISQFRRCRSFEEVVPGLQHAAEA